jgi:hypothetical protein
MPFLTQCMFCNHQIQAPDHSLGASGRCPKCSNWFTLVPATTPARGSGTAFRRGPVVRPAPPPSPSGGASAMPSQTPLPPSKSPQHLPPLVPKQAEVMASLPVPSEPPSPVAAPLPFVTTVPEFHEPGSEVPFTRRLIHPAGAAALLLAGLALLCAAVQSLCFLVLPLAILAFLIGAIGTFVAWPKGGMRLGFVSAGAVVAVAVLGTALLAPGLLGPLYQGYRQKDEDLTKIRAVPLPGQPASDDLLDPEGAADATRAALQQGRLRVQVAAVTVGPLPPADGSKKKANPEEFLVIRLRANRVEGGKEFAADPARWPGHQGARPRPTLTDNTGKVYRERSVLSDPENVGKSTLFPVAVVDEAFAFEPPATGVGQLRLEVPAELWGGSGVFRFTIPNTMITRQPVGSARPGRPGG